MTVLMQYLLACNILDIVTGFIKAYDQKDISSKKMKHGALSKVSMWCVVLVTTILSSYLEADFTGYILGYYLIMEIVSILENASFFIPVPDKIKNMLNNEQIEKTKKDNNVDAEMLDYINMIDKKEENKNE